MHELLVTQAVLTSATLTCILHGEHAKMGCTGGHCQCHGQFCCLSRNSISTVGVGIFKL